MDEIRGNVIAVGVTDARIPWPIGLKVRGRSLVVYGGLARAIRQESGVAVFYWWGVSKGFVRARRRALNVPEKNEGSRRLRAKMGEAQLGTTLPTHVRRAISAAVSGRPKTIEHRRKRSLAHKSRGSRPPYVGRPWTEPEIALLKELPPAQVAQRTGRSVKAVSHQRRSLGLAAPQRRASPRIARNGKLPKAAIGNDTGAGKCRGKT